MRLPPLLFCLTSLSSTGLGYSLVREYSGANFFNDKQGNPLWDFYGSWDNLTQGDVWWLDSVDSFSQHLAYVNENNQVVLKVDTSSNVLYNDKRNSIRIESRDRYDVGSLWIVDLSHVPSGCSVWPAFWTHADIWPAGGEIDIFETINLQAGNQMALHTMPGCENSPPPDETGVTDELDCSSSTGCVVHESAANSAGPGFNSAGGGVWAAQFDVTGIYIWFWPRSKTPTSIALASASSGIDMSTWGPPSASFPATSCNIPEFFAPQRLVFDITLCGTWAGESTEYLQTCSGAGPTGNCYLDNVIGPGSPKYDEAYFEVNYLQAYTTGLPAPSPTGVADFANPTATLLLPHRSGASSRLPPRKLLLPAVVSISSLIRILW